MECLLAFFVVIVMLSVLATSLAQFHSGAGRRRRAYQQLAKRFAGNYSPGGLVSRPNVRMRYGETRAVLRESQGRGPYEGKCTQIQIEWPDYRVVCEILSGNNEASFGIRGLLDQSTNDQEFDDRFWVRGSAARDVQELLTDGVRWQIDRLAAASGNSGLYLLMRRGTILIQKPQLIRGFEELEEFTGAALDLYDQVMLARAEGIEFVAGTEAQTLEEVICKVCGEPIITDLVFCRRCKTPHHGECWSYVGTCSVYGCMEKACLHPQTAAPTEPPDSGSNPIKPR